MIGNILSIDDVRKALELSEFSDSEMAEDVDSVVFHGRFWITATKRILMFIST